MAANNRQVGGDHYKAPKGEEHWDRIWRMHGRGYFVGSVTKYVERYHRKNGVEDLEKAKHFLEKLIELEKAAAPAPLPDTSTVYESNAEFLCEGGWGDGLNLYTHKVSGIKVKAASLKAAHDVYEHDMRAVARANP